MNRYQTTWESRSLLSKSAHIIERTGLATVGASCALFVAAQIGTADIDLLESGMIVIMIVFGALGFYLGIDLPPPAEPRARLPLLRTHYTKADRVGLLSASGTFLASVAAFLSVYIIVVDERVPRGFTLSIGTAWAFGAVMQIAAGVLARARETDQSEP